MKLEPFGSEAEFYRAGLIAATVANCHRDSKKRQKPFQPSDFMPVFETVEKAQVSIEAKMAIAGAMMRAQIAKDNPTKTEGIPEWALSKAQRSARDKARLSEPMIVLTDK